MDDAHEANAAGEYERARRLFTRSNELVPRAAARLSAANMVLKLGDAAAAMQVYLDLLATGAMKPDHQLLQRKMKEATARLSAAGRR
jgi:hypothetical protein